MVSIGSTVLLPLDPVENVVDPLVLIFPDEGDSIDVEQEQDFEPFLVLGKFRVVTGVPYDFEFLLSVFSGVLMNLLTSTGDFKVLFLFDFLLEPLFFVEELSPSVERNIVLHVLFLKNFLDEFCIF